MNIIDKYVEEKEKEIKNLGLTEELDIIKYIYMDLGNRLSFDHNFIPFGNSKSRERIYKYNSRNIIDLEKCLITNTAICKSLSYLLEYVLERFNVEIKTVADPIDFGKYPHVFNLIYLKDGRKFCVDLQEDINNIQTHSFTSNFGLETIYDSKLVVDKQEQQEIDKRIGYLKDNEYYTDDYLYLLHSVADGITDFREKVRFILENIEYTSTKDMGYIDRQWHHKKVLEEFFSEREFEYEHNTGKIRMFDCYKEVKGQKKFLNFVTVNQGDNVDIYVYNVKKSKYCEMEIDAWLNCMQNGIQVNGKAIKGVRKKKVMVQ